MGPDTTQPWSGLPRDLQSPLIALVYRLELLQRQLLRTNGLSTLEREMLLGTVAAARLELERFARRLDSQARDRNPSEGGNDAGWSRR